MEGKFASAHQISSKSDDSRLRCNDKIIVKMPAAILNIRNLVFWSCDVRLGDSAWICKILFFFCHVTVLGTKTCICKPNFIKIG